MTLIPNHFERQLMQQLRGRGWVKASGLPPSPRIIGHLLRKGWIEAQGAENDLAYRMTEEGMTAKTAPIPKYR
jgi:chromosome segregation and condensation protein ScpB